MMAVGEFRQEEIAKEVGVHENTIGNIITSHKNGKLAEIVGIPPASLQYTNLREFNQCDPEQVEFFD
jgi:hypothetical protein